MCLHIPSSLYFPCTKQLTEFRESKAKSVKKTEGKQSWNAEEKEKGKQQNIQWDQQKQKTKQWELVVVTGF